MSEQEHYILVSIFTNMASTRCITGAGRTVLGVTFLFDDATIKLHFVTLWRLEQSYLCPYNTPSNEADQGSFPVCIRQH